MSGDVATVLLGPLQGLLSWFVKNRMHKDAQTDAALFAINKALFASMKYAEAEACGENRDRSHELELAELWANAAAVARHASSELALRLQDKSIYWSTEMKWSREEVLLRRIDFRSIQLEIAKLLK